MNESESEEEQEIEEVCTNCNYRSAIHNTAKCLKDHKMKCEMVIEEQTMIKELEELKKQNQALKEELQQSKQIIINNNIINNDNSKNLTINISLPYNIDHLIDEDYFNILGHSLMSMIEKIHFFNENVPENHNIYIPDIKKTNMQ